MLGAPVDCGPTRGLLLGPRGQGRVEGSETDFRTSIPHSSLGCQRGQNGRKRSQFGRFRGSQPPVGGPLGQETHPSPGRRGPNRPPKRSSHSQQPWAHFRLTRPATRADPMDRLGGGRGTHWERDFVLLVLNSGHCGLCPGGRGSRGHGPWKNVQVQAARS